MTNAEKYLKDEVSVDDFLAEVIKHCSQSAKNSIETFLNDNSKPTLTEDERVILRNIKEEKIGRLENGNLYVTSGNYGRKYAYLRYFKHLFQFIKNGEEYSIEELLKGE